MKSNGLKVSLLNDFIKSVDGIIKKANSTYSFLYISKSGLTVEDGRTKVFLKHTFGFDIVVDYFSIKKLGANLAKEDILYFEKLNNDAIQPDLFIHLDGEVIMNLKHMTELYAKPKEIFSVIFENNVSQLGKLTPADISTIIGLENFTGNDDLRPQMQCVNLDDCIAATDGTFLSFHKATSPIKTLKISETVIAGLSSDQNLEVKENEYSLMIHPLALKVLKIFNKETFNCYLGYKTKKEKVRWANESTETVEMMHGRLVSEKISIEFPMEERFPNWRTVVPNFEKQHTPFREYFLNRSTFLKALKIARISNPRRLMLRFKKDESKVFMYSHEPDNDSISQREIDYLEVTDYPYEGKSSEFEEIGMDATRIETVLRGSKEREFSIKIVRPSSGFVIDGKYLLMPVMIDVEVNY